MIAVQGLEDLITRFLARAAQRAQEVDRALSDLDGGRSEAVAKIERIAHRLAGSAGSFGLLELGASAETAERAAMALRAGRAHDVALVKLAAEALRDELARTAFLEKPPAAAPLRRVGIR